jgi:hypothetical protein
MLVQQNLLLCLLFSVLAGLSYNASKAVVLLQHKWKNEGWAHVCTQLLSNAIFVGVILQTEPMGKVMQVAVIIMSLSFIYLPIVGPGIQEDQDLYNVTLGNPFGVLTSFGPLWLRNYHVYYRS